MSLTLTVKNPTPQVGFTTDELHNAWVSFIHKAKLYREQYKKRKGLTDEDMGGEFHWKDEHFAKIFKSKFDVTAQACSYYAGAELEIVDETPHMYIVYTEGYWEAIGG